MNTVSEDDTPKMSINIVSSSGSHCKRNKRSSWLLFLYPQKEMMIWQQQRNYPLDHGDVKYTPTQKRYHRRTELSKRSEYTDHSPAPSRGLQGNGNASRWPLPGLQTRNLHRGVPSRSERLWMNISVPGRISYPPGQSWTTNAPGRTISSLSCLYPSTGSHRKTYRGR